MKSETEVVVKEEDWTNSIYRTQEWEQSVEVLRWEHDFEKRIYIIRYAEKGGEG